MQQTRFLTLTNKFFVLLLLAINFVSCNSGNKKDSKEIKVEDFISDDDIFDDIDKAKKIFYSLPSPLETAQIIKSAGAEYDHELLNSLDNIQKYSSSKSKALNLGIYTTDLSFSSLFEQTQTAIDYMGAARAMAEGLDIRDAIDNETIRKLEDNLNNRDVVMDIISETFLNSSSYLKDYERQDEAAIVLIGGWVEGLYIASELVGNKNIEGNKLVNRILEQKLSFNIVMRLLEDNKKNASGETNEDIAEMITELVPLNQAFEKVTVMTTKASVEGEDKSGVAKISSKTTVKVTPEDFKTLQSTIRNLRTSFIQ
jgi:hypothetical protein